MTRKEILDQANAIVHGDRQNDYGPPEDSFSTIAGFWTGYLRSRGLLVEGAALDPADSGLMMVLLKVARASGGLEKGDNYVDGAGYFACAGELGTRTKPEECPFGEKYKETV